MIPDAIRSLSCGGGGGTLPPFHASQALLTWFPREEHGGVRSHRRKGNERGRARRGRPPFLRRPRHPRPLRSALRCLSLHGRICSRGRRLSDLSYAGHRLATESAAGARPSRLSFLSALQSGDGAAAVDRRSGARYRRSRTARPCCVSRCGAGPLLDQRAAARSSRLSLRKNGASLRFAAGRGASSKDAHLAAGSFPSD
jgi:hypothetical protein